MHYAEFTIGRRLMDARDASGTGQLGAKLAEMIESALDGISIKLNRKDADELGASLNARDLAVVATMLIGRKYGDTAFSKWSTAQRAAAYYLHAILKRCPKLANQLTDGAAELIVTIYSAPTMGFDLEINWPEDDHPLIAR